MKYRSTMICDKTSYDAKSNYMCQAPSASLIDLVPNYYFRYKNTLHLKFRHDNMKLVSSLIMT